MAEDWSNLADDYEDEDHILIGKVDCTKDSNTLLCKEYFGVTSYPTLLYGDVIQLQEYKGERELGDLRDVVEENLEQPLCGVANPQLCDVNMKQQLEDLMAKGFATLDKEIKEYEETVGKLEKQQGQAVNDLRKKYSKEMKRKDKRKAEFEESSNLDLMRQILQMKEEDAKNGKTSSSSSGRDEL